MGNTLRATVTIRGTRPLWWHHFGPDAIPLEKQERTGVAGNDPEEWRRTVQMNADRQLFVDGANIFRMCRDGAKYTKKGKGSIQVAMSATLQIADDQVFIDQYVPPEPIPLERTEPVYLDIRSVVNPNTKSRNVRYRIAAAAGWTATFHLLWDKTIVSRGEMEAVLRDAGQLIGLGNGRTIGMGRFDVLDCEVVEQ